MDSNKEALNEITRSIDYLVNQKLNKTTKIYDGILLPNGLVRINGKDYSVKQYGEGSFEPNTLVKVFVPQGNMNMAFWEKCEGGSGVDYLTVVDGQICVIYEVIE